MFCKQRMNLATILFMSFYVMAIGANLIQGRRQMLEQCDGHVDLIDQSKLSIRYTNNSTSMNFKPTKAILNGCRCFKLFEKQNGRGRGFLLNKIGATFVPLKRVKSLYKVSCEKNNLLVQI